MNGQGSVLIGWVGEWIRWDRVNGQGSVLIGWVD